MSAKERPDDRGRRRGRNLLTELVAEGRRARVDRNLSQKSVGRALGLSDSRISLIERAEYATVPFVVIAQYLAAVGLELSAGAYPVGGGLRDVAQLKLLERLRARLSGLFSWRTEVPLPIGGDLRALGRGH